MSPRRLGSFVVVAASLRWQHVFLMAVSSVAAIQRTPSAFEIPGTGHDDPVKAAGAELRAAERTPALRGAWRSPSTALGWCPERRLGRNQASGASVSVVRRHAAVAVVRSSRAALPAIVSAARACRPRIAARTFLILTGKSDILTVGGMPPVLERHHWWDATNASAVRNAVHLIGGETLW